MLIHKTENKREAFRYHPVPSNNLTVNFLGKELPLIDISAGGVSFRNHGFIKGNRDLITLVLQDSDLKPNHLLSIAIRIIHIDAENICHCLFENPLDDQKEAIHHFLLVKQKKDLRQKQQVE